MPAAVLVLLLAVLFAAPVRAEEAPPAPDAAPRGPEVVPLRFAWPLPADAHVTYRRTRTRTGAKPSSFLARFRSRVEREEGGLRITTSGTSWKGDLPFPAGAAAEAIRASEEVVQRVTAEGEFAGLEGTEAMRPVLRRMFDELKVPPEQAERAVALAEGSMRGEAEELWNLAVGFWTGADLELAETYVMDTESELPFAPGVRAASAVEFEVRRRVPCAAGEREARCVEVTLRATPERAAVERAAPAILARLAGAEPVPREALRDLAVESELVLVTEPGTLLPRRLAWTKSARAESGERGAPALEAVDRSEYDYRWGPPTAPAKRNAKPKKARPPRGPEQASR
jgi:hypothetical protein